MNTIELYPLLLRIRKQHALYRAAVEEAGLRFKGQRLGGAGMLENLLGGPNPLCLVLPLPDPVRLDMTGLREKESDPQEDFRWCEEGCVITLCSDLEVQVIAPLGTLLVGLGAAFFEYADRGDVIDLLKRDPNGCMVWRRIRGNPFIGSRQRNTPFEKSPQIEVQGCTAFLHDEDGRVYVRTHYTI